MAPPSTLTVLRTEATSLFDLREAPRCRIQQPPAVHVAQDLGRWLPFLAASGARPVVCVSDWQFEPATQRHFWEQAVPVLEDAVGGPAALAGALFLVAGDMASCDDAARGERTDAEPDLEPFRACVGPRGVLHWVYGNHDEEVPSARLLANPGGASEQLPDGSPIDTCWPEGRGEDGGSSSSSSARRPRSGLLLGGVHGIPSSDSEAAKRRSGTSRMKKRDRGEYFARLAAVCGGSDIVLLHCNPKLPGQSGVGGEDAPRICRTFREGRAQLLVHGHMHTPEVVAVVGGKVVVNSDCRIVVLLPDDAAARHDADPESVGDGPEGSLPLPPDLDRLTTEGGGLAVPELGAREWVQTVLDSPRACAAVAEACFRRHARAQEAVLADAQVADCCAELSARLRIPPPTPERLAKALGRFDTAAGGLGAGDFQRFVSMFLRAALPHLA